MFGWSQSVDQDGKTKLLTDPEPLGCPPGLQLGRRHGTKCTIHTKKDIEHGT